MFGLLIARRSFFEYFVRLKFHHHFWFWVIDSQILHQSTFIRLIIQGPPKPILVSAFVSIYIFKYSLVVKKVGLLEPSSCYSAFQSSLGWIEQRVLWTNLTKDTKFWRLSKNMSCSTHPSTSLWAQSWRTVKPFFWNLFKIHHVPLSGQNGSLINLLSLNFITFRTLFLAFLTHQIARFIDSSRARTKALISPGSAESWNFPPLFSK